MYLNPSYLEEATLLLYLPLLLINSVEKNIWKSQPSHALLCYQNLHFWARQFIWYNYNDYHNL